MLSDLLRVVFQKPVFIEAGFHIDEDIANEDYDGGSIQIFKQSFIIIEWMVLFINQKVPNARIMGIWMKYRYIRIIFTNYQPIINLDCGENTIEQANDLFCCACLSG